MPLELSQDQTTSIGITNWRNQNIPFGIKDKDRLGHIYVIGKTGVGKSTLLQTIAVNDIEKGAGICFIDPHGDVADDILNYAPEHRISDIIYFSPADYPVPFNPLYAIAPQHQHLAASALISTFSKIWASSWGPRLEHILRHSILTLLEYSEAALSDIQPLLTNQVFRERILGAVKSKYLLDFWQYEFDRYAPTMRAEIIASVLNKVGLFNASVPLRDTVGQRTPGLNLRQMMDEGKVLICNLSKGRLGEDAAALIGSMLVSGLYLAALSRADQEREQRLHFRLLIDECHSFTDEHTISQILSESRKFGLSLILAHQYVQQLTEKARAAIFGNVGTMICFRVGAEDAKYLAPEFAPTFTETDLISLPKYSMYLKMMIDGAMSKAFSANTISVKQMKQPYKNEIIERCNKEFSKHNRSTQNEDYFAYKVFCKTECRQSTLL